MSTNTALDQIKARVEGHTEGPWRVETDSEQDYEQGIPFSEWPSVIVGPENAYPSEWAKKHGETRRVQEVAELSMADAELIAAAPKLLAALEAVEARIAEHESRIPWPVAPEVDKAYSLGKEHAYRAIRAEIEEALREEK